MFNKVLAKNLIKTFHFRSVVHGVSMNQTFYNYTQHLNNSHFLAKIRIIIF